MINGIRKRWRLRKSQRQWRRLHSHNRTEAGTLFNPAKVSVGNFTYGRLNVMDSYYDNEKLEIGHFCSIADEVRFFLGGNHFVDRPTTYPVHGLLSGQRGGDGYSKGPIRVGSDVWIGYGANIFSGVEIGQGAVIGAGSVVVKDVPPYAIVAGNRAEIIRYRFDGEMIAELLKIDYSWFTLERCRTHEGVLTNPLNREELDRLFAAMRSAT